MRFQLARPRPAWVLLVALVAGACSSDGEAPPVLDPGPVGDGGGRADTLDDAAADAPVTDAAPDVVADGAPEALAGDADGAADDAARDTAPDGGGAHDATADAPAACSVPGPCDPLGANTCPPGQACRLTGGMGACTAISGSPVAAGQPCQTSERCDHGLACVDLGAGARCTALCRAGSQGACGTGAACSLELSGSSCARLCAPLARACDIYAATGCESGQKCGLARHPETGARYTGCIPAGAGQVGTACTADGQCVAGTICVGAGGEARCHQVCGPGGAPACLVPGQTCSGTSMLWNVSYCR